MRGWGGVRLPNGFCVGVLARDKQKELEVLMHDQDYDLIGITKAWWAKPHDWNINTRGCRLFWKDGQGIREECVALYIKDEDVLHSLSLRSRENLDATLPVALGHVEGASSETAWLSQTQGMAGMENFPSQAASAREDSR